MGAAPEDHPHRYAQGAPSGALALCPTCQAPSMVGDDPIRVRPARYNSQLAHVAGKDRFKPERHGSQYAAVLIPSGDSKLSPKVFCFHFVESSIGQPHVSKVADSPASLILKLLTLSRRYVNDGAAPETPVRATIHRPDAREHLSPVRGSRGAPGTGATRTQVATTNSTR